MAKLKMIKTINSILHSISPIKNKNNLTKLKNNNPKIKRISIFTVPLDCANKTVKISIKMFTY